MGGMFSKKLFATNSEKENNLSQIIVFHHLAMFHQYSNKPFEDKNNNQFACIH